MSIKTHCLSIVFAVSLTGCATQKPDTEASLAVVERFFQGAVVAFDRADCPKGWSPFEPAIGRFIIGANNDKEVENSLISANLGDVGGAISHNHGGLTGPGDGRNGEDDDDHPRSNAGHRHAITESKHVPPYLALTYCRRN